MSQKETFLLSDGRKTSDLKVTELKKELEKKGLSKSGNKSELLIRLNESINDTLENSQIEKENSESSENQNEINDDHNQLSYSKQDKFDDSLQNDMRVVNIKKSDTGVDLDASDDMEKDSADISQSVDALDLYVPMDDSLNPADESVQEERIQVTISRNDETDLKSDDESNNRVVETVIVKERTVIRANNDSEKEETLDMECMVDDSDLKEGKQTEREKIAPLTTTDQEVTENEGDEVENIDLVTQVEMYEVDNIDLDGHMEIYEEHKEDNEQNIADKAVESRDTDNATVVTVKQDESHEPEAVDETEEGEVVTVPITARLGKRKVREESKSHSSPKKSKKKGLKETKGAGYIVEGPERIQPAQKSRNIISDVLRVDNLVRPFTLLQLQDMLATQGLIKDVWLNKIKSVAYVRYDSEDVAISARENIDGCRWPSINPKLLLCDFVFLKEMEWMKEKGDSGANPPPSFNPSIANQNATKDVSKPHHQHEHKHQQHEPLAKPGLEHNWRHGGAPDPGKVRSNHTNNSRGTHADTNYKPDNLSNNIGSKPSTDDAKRRGVKDRDVVDTKPQHRRTPNAEHRRRHDSPKEHQSRERAREKSKDKVLPAAKLLEDIFRKTITQPAIYWLPVTKEKKDDPIKKAKEVTSKSGADL